MTETNRAVAPTGRLKPKTDRAAQVTNLSARATNRAARPTNLSARVTNRLARPTNLSARATNRAARPTNLSAQVTNQLAQETHELRLRLYGVSWLSLGILSDFSLAARLVHVLFPLIMARSPTSIASGFVVLNVRLTTEAQRHGAGQKKNHESHE